MIKMCIKIKYRKEIVCLSFRIQELEYTLSLQQQDQEDEEPGSNGSKQEIDDLVKQKRELEGKLDEANNM